MKKFILFVAILVLAFSGCKTATPETQTTNRQNDNRKTQETVKIGAGIYKVDFTTNPQSAKASEPTELMFAVKMRKAKQSRIFKSYTKS